MKFVLIVILGFLGLIGFFLINGCEINESTSIDLTKNEAKNLPMQDNCNKPLGVKDVGYVSAEIEKENANVIYFDSESNETKATAEILLNPKWLKRLGDDATYFVNYNEQLNIERDSILSASNKIAKEGIKFSPCEMSEDGKLHITATYPKGVTSNFSNVLDSYNESVEKRNASFRERLAKFQNDFKETKFTIKSEKYAKDVKPYPLNNTADLSYLESLYKSRIKDLTIISRGLRNEQ